MSYLWQHGIDEYQDAVIEAACYEWHKTTGAFISPHEMVKLIIMRYGEDLGTMHKFTLTSEQRTQMRLDMLELREKYHKK